MTPDRLSFGLAGMASEEGVLGRPLRLGRWLANTESARIDEDGVIWADSPAHEWPTIEAAIADHMKADKRMLDNFLAVAGSDARSSALSFVQRYGLPEICAEHHEPVGHIRPITGLIWPMADYPVTICPELTQDDTSLTLGVRLDDFRRAATALRAALRIAALAHRGLPSTNHDLRWINPTDWDWPDVPVDVGREFVQGYLDGLLMDLRVHPKFDWWDFQGPTFQLSALGPYGIVALQAVFTIVRADGFAMCAGCGAPFIPTRQPRADQRSWCVDCKPAARRAAAREYKQRKRMGECNG